MNNQKERAIYSLLGQKLPDDVIGIIVEGQRVNTAPIEHRFAKLQETMKQNDYPTHVRITFKVGCMRIAIDTHPSSVHFVWFDTSNYKYQRFALY
jgi:hypothetical protein